MDFLSTLFGIKNESAASASVSLSNGTAPNGLAAKLNTPAPQLGGRRQRLRTPTGIARTAKRIAKHQRNAKRRTHKRK